ncbi:trypsin-like peptidase domain-containing protein [Phototrophicus methaneseepsis]|uniref:Trypsin-like peptidase domain-containing protein n=1 Tax=Phototrophicus methaneseepsis TaxID=2710758 RepID=A0A7S8IFH5_9CHLR|nr:trypsin-like peptidase domain-containing protein [Phototrophicus methaneseepsis]QPC84735.1 trypsin-like peptidase domain-containing protein [Phototrophicus methaneseepsis]
MAQILQDLSNAMASTVEELTPSIVTVDARRRMPATGVIHSADGIIVTSHHVIESDENVGIVTSDGTRLDATLVGRDPYNDLAVLRINASDLAPVSWAEADALKVGNLVLALGKPGEQVQATLGVVSSLVSGSRWKEMREALQKRHEEHGGGMRRGPGGRGRGRRGRHDHGPRGRRPFMGMALADGHIATDVVMYPGFSGGPLVSGDGLIHGVNTSGFGRGISISVPVSTIASTIDTLLTHGRMRQGYLGVGVQPARLPEGLVEDQETGLLVVSVEKDSPAANAGLIVGDIIVALDDESVTEVDELLALLTGDRAGQEVSVDIVRGGVLQSMTVTIAERV